MGSPALPDATELPAPFGRYLLEAVLGEGGRGRVYRATLQGESGFRKQVALKVIRPSGSGRDELAEKVFFREARMGGLLSHPNVIDVYDFGVHQGHPFLAMELVRGWPLDHLKAHFGGLPPRVVLDLAIQVAEGLQHAHELEVDGEAVTLVHRDLKPENVLVTPQGRVKILDFGLARSQRIDDKLTATGVVQGTPAYMSPEQAGGVEELDPRSDLFAYGVVLYEVATGQLPWERPTFTAQVIALVQVEELTAAPGFWDGPEKGCPGSAEILQKCLRLEPRDRYARTADLVAALRQLDDQLEPGPDLRAWLDDKALNEPRAVGSSTEDETLMLSMASEVTELEPRESVGGRQVTPLEGPWPATYSASHWQATLGIEEFGRLYLALDELPSGASGATTLHLEGLSPASLPLVPGSAVLLGDAEELLGAPPEANPWSELIVDLSDGERLPLTLEGTG